MKYLSRSKLVFGTNKLMDIKNIQLDQLEQVNITVFVFVISCNQNKASIFYTKGTRRFSYTDLQILIIIRPSEINIHEEICNKEAAEKSITYIQRDLIVKRRWYTEQSDLLWDPVIVRANPHVIHADQVLHMVYVI